jgi:inhibitor of cysteine peptidase
MSEFPSQWKAVVLVVVIAAAGLAALAFVRGPSGVPRQLTSPERDCGMLDHFTSIDDLKAHLQASPSWWSWILTGGLLLGAEGDARATYSGTNNQVAGVDEADIVKTDGTYIYGTTWNASTYGSEVAIVRAYPPQDAALVATIPVDSWVQGLFLDGDRLAVIGGGGFAYVLGGGIWPGGYYRSQTRLLVYDVSVPSAPALVKNVSVSGSYVGARLIEGTAYLVVQDYLYLIDNGTSVVLPTIWTDGSARDLTYADIGYFADSEGSSADLIVLAVDLRTADPPEVESFLTRGMYQLYVSASNLYVAGVEWESNPDRTVVAESSTVHKISVDDGDVEYVCSARVPGTSLNQFSMDEADGHLRVATTLGQWTPDGRDTSAAVFVFDDLLNPVGELTGLAPGERIFAARFLDGRAYLVTYRQVDPLFVLDVSDPRDPRVLGSLKVPGVSDYLHPLDETHLIGVGRDDPGGTGRLHGLKLSLFDVADVERPAEVASYVIGGGEDEWAWSDVVYDHKAFLLVPDPGRVVLPVSLTRWDERSYGYWQGAYAVAVDPQGFVLEATITHQSSEDSYDGRSQVRRSLYIGDVLYTVSGALVLGNSMDTFAEVARVPL